MGPGSGCWVSKRQHRGVQPTIQLLTEFSLIFQSMQSRHLVCCLSQLRIKQWTIMDWVVINSKHMFWKLSSSWSRIQLIWCLERIQSVSQMFHSSRSSHGRRVRELSRVIPLMRVPVSWPNHTPQAKFLNTAVLGFRISTYEVLTDTYKLCPSASFLGS